MSLHIEETSTRLLPEGPVAPQRVRLKLLLLVSVVGLLALVTLSSSSIMGVLTPSISYEDLDNGNPNPANLYLVADPDAICNDGTPAGYYFRQGLTKDKWIFYLEDQTGWCWDGPSCDYRNATLPHLMGSDSWATYMNGSDYHGLLSPNATVNPYMYDAYLVHIKYCSSDFFTGSADEPSDGYYFRGADIIRAVVARVLEDEAVYDAKQILYAGSGPGATGAQFTIDAIYEQFRDAGLFEDGSKAEFRGFMDSGYLYQIDPYTPRTCDENLGSCDFTNVTQMGSEIWDPLWPVDCAAAYPGEEWLCYFGNYSHQFIQTPLFVFQNQYDFTALDVAGAGILHGWFAEEAVEYAEFAATRFLSDVGRNVEYGFFPACYATTVLHTDDWDKVSLRMWVDVDGNVTSYLNEALELWWSVPLDTDQLYVDDCRSINCNPTCAEY